MVLSVKLNPAAGASQGRPQSAIASYVWGPDIGSQPFARRDWQAAGGVRGLLMANYFTGANGGGVHVPAMDPMGNVTSVTRLGVSYSSGGPFFRSEFVYDYDAFGKEMRSSSLVSGLNPDSFPFHYSTKFLDPETGFNYYGYRFYDPANGRWINRDPIGEMGGSNIYGMTGNKCPLRYDLLGLAWHHVVPPGAITNDWLESKGITDMDLDDSSNSLDLDSDTHDRIHSGEGRGGDWNKDWEEWRDSVDREGKDISKSDLDKAAHDIKKKHGLLDEEKAKGRYKGQNWKKRGKAFNKKFKNAKGLPICALLAFLNAARTDADAETREKVQETIDAMSNFGALSGYGGKEDDAVTAAEGLSDLFGNDAGINAATLISMREKALKDAQCCPK